MLNNFYSQKNNVTDPNPSFQILTLYLSYTPTCACEKGDIDGVDPEIFFWGATKRK